VEPALASLGSLYERSIVESGKEPEFLFFVSFLVSFGFIRSSAHMIRAQVRWWPGNVEVGGTHVHHLVWGILLLLTCGYVAVSFQPESPGAELVAIGFGIGTGLALDEFALWLTLRDVYWEQEGRRSIDAVIVVAAVAGLMLIGFRAWIDLADGVRSEVFHLVGWTTLVTMISVAVNLLKGKFGVAAAGLVIGPVAWVGALRLARPGSPWSRRYSGERRARAEARFDPGG
jgi:lysyl-tRNA synthetase class 2